MTSHTFWAGSRPQVDSSYPIPSPWDTSTAQPGMRSIFPQDGQNSPLIRTATKSKHHRSSGVVVTWITVFLRWLPRGFRKRTPNCFMHHSPMCGRMARFAGDRPRKPAVLPRTPSSRRSTSFLREAGSIPIFPRERVTVAPQISPCCIRSSIQTSHILLKTSCQPGTRWNGSLGAVPGHFASRIHHNLMTRLSRPTSYRGKTCMS